MIVRWLYGFLWIWSAFPAVAQTDINPGLLMDDPGYEASPYQAIVTKKKLPARVSYESFCPSVQAQGSYGTCVGFACGYYLRSIIVAKTKQTTNKTTIDQLAFSPGYLYEKAKSERDYACSEGIYLSKAFDVLKSVGVVPFKNFPYPSCGQKTEAVDAVATRFRIDGYERLFDVQETDEKKIYNLKKTLADESPVVVGIVVPQSFYFAGKVWKPAPNEDPGDKRLRGHALCIIGYDDKLYGGAFRVVNSFGKAWADQGFCWISYRDLVRFTRYGYKINVQKPPVL
jgi:C1A family cysteine protease